MEIRILFCDVEDEKKEIEQLNEEENKWIGKPAEESKQLTGHLRRQVNEENQSVAFLTAKPDNELLKRE
jgi:hypothetical protein